jgi:hypothetical protein
MLAFLSLGVHHEAAEQVGWTSHMQLIWHGTDEEYEKLIAVLERHCSCDTSGNSAQVTCAAHRMLLEQRSVDRLLFGLRIAHRLRREEHAPTTRGRVWEPSEC